MIILLNIRLGNKIHVSSRNWSYLYLDNTPENYIIIANTSGLIRGPIWTYKVKSISAPGSKWIYKKKNYLHESLFNKSPKHYHVFLVGSMLSICLLVVRVVFLSFWSCSRCSPEFVSTFTFSLFYKYPLGIS